ncbi:MAG: bifunctional adenosylcobinamide kinase/adenosylcobinamide-phosphate guanylyltransferase [Rhodospirillaceae bacterium]|nr:MAG: bifunctional adenosylcobinamide kinase/adenosylcobinamide-phosphate guanylyltransferase [Rhodospirillaceae bacterium]
MQAPLTLILGGQRSGKSAYAQSLLTSGGVYLATGEGSDAEMSARIKAHQDRRGEGWLTVEEPLDLASALAQMPKDKPVLVDSLGMWVSNMLYKELPLDLETLAETLHNHPTPVVIVSDIVGLGVIPMNAVARAFVDTLGSANQVLAAKAARVVLVTAGLCQILKEQ